VPSPQPENADLKANSSRLSWRESIALYGKPKVLALLFLGFSAGLPFLLVFSTLTAWLTEAGVTRTTIGFFSWIGITYSIKVIWAPVVDKLKLPLLHRMFGQRRSWILLGQLGIASGLVLMALTDPEADVGLMAVFGLLVAFSSATQDISIDAYRIESAEDKYQAAMSAAYVFGYRLALLVAGAGALYLAEYLGWSPAYLVMAALMGVGVVTVLLIQEPNGLRPAAEPVIHRAKQARLAQRLGGWFADAVIGPFVDFFKRNGWYALLILLFIAVYRISDITMGVMANPFYLDIGFSKTEIADVTKVFGFVMTIVGSALGGVLVAHYGIRPILLLGGCMVALTNLLFAWLATSEPGLAKLALVISADNLSGGLAIVAFIAYLSSLTSSAYTATQYALFSSLMTLPGKFIGGFGGIVVDTAGYPSFFIYAAVLGIPAIMLVCVLIYLDRSGRAGAKQVAVAGSSSTTT
jgi:PAT family beta-lactamase induction signal transducer AmpG